MEKLKKVVDLAEKVRHVFVATADATGLPHVASVGKLTYEPDGRVVLADWFCPATVTNLQQNPQIAIVAWDTATDFGYQILGEVERVKELGIMDGYVPGEEDKPPLPQVERELLVRVDKIIAFSHAPHSDVEE